ncbi:hypothetical protein [Saccharothrix syringae]|uniref:hypothetical protein n=1 Tax=Saccharothrix syringae TaxID=103733 RepID=UPI00068CFFC2|nr:hypothetical protein [Saccharothrix syringae]
MGRRSGGVGALPLAAALTAAYVVVAGGAGVLALRAASAPPPAATTTTTPGLPAITPPSPAPGSPSPAPGSPSSVPTPPTTDPAAAPPGFRTSRAPGGLVTVVPEGWPVRPGTVATTLVAADPADPRREVRFGGAPVTDPGRTLLERITAAAVEREREPGHARLGLGAAEVRGFPAVRWEFEEAGARTAVAYWETGGTEYVVYASGPAGDWPATGALLTTMVDAARP